MYSYLSHSDFLCNFVEYFQNFAQRYRPNIPEFEKRIAESDAYLKILLDQIKVCLVIYNPISVFHAEMGSVSVTKLCSEARRSSFDFSGWAAE